MHFEKSVNSSKNWINVLKQSVFWGVHLICLAVFIVGWSWAAIGMCIFMYVLRMFAITGGYHRYFSHRSFQTSRWFQFLLAFLGATAAQKGPLWWASHHRHHHKYSDTEQDLHSTKVQGFWFAHVGWILCDQFVESRPELVRDLRAFPELMWLERNHLVAPISLAVLIFFFGVMCSHLFPSSGITGSQMLIWGFFVSTMILYHCTFFINSLAHLVGSKRFKTGDESRNSFWLAILTLGEGWHNNHHRYPGSERQGFYWWEIDITHYILVLLSKIGLVWNLNKPPARIYSEAKAIGAALN